MLLDLLEKMAGNSQPAVSTVNSQLSMIDVVKFDCTNNFGMWKCEVMNALTTSNLEDSLCLEEKPEKTSKKNWDKMNKTACEIIRYYLTQHIQYHMMIETSGKNI